MLAVSLLGHLSLW